MKRILVESLMAGALVFLLIRMPLDLMLFDTGPAPQFLSAGPGLDAAAAGAAASWAWLAGGVAALLTLMAGLVIAGARRADRNHAAAIARLSPSAGEGRSDPASSPSSWRPRANAYVESLRHRAGAPVRRRKVADIQQLRTPRTARVPAAAVRRFS